MTESHEKRSSALDDCLNLLKAETDKQRLTGLHLLTKFCHCNDVVSLKKVYEAVDTHFLDRFLSSDSDNGVLDNHDMYLQQLSVTALVAFSRVPEIASSSEMVLKIPLILQILSMECYEILYLMSTASEEAVMVLIYSGALKVIPPQISYLPDGSQAIKILQLLVSKLSGERLRVTEVSQQFAVLHNALKFEALHLLSAVFTSKYSKLLHKRLRSMLDNNWADYIRTGVVAVLQNCVEPSEKIHALILSESMTSIFSEKWLIGRVNLPNVEEYLLADRCLLLLLESSHFEISVLVKDLIFMKYGALKNSSTIEVILLKQKHLVIAFRLVEKIIKYIYGEDKETLTGVGVFRKMIKTLEEIVFVVFKYLKAAKEHGKKKGYDLLASVRLIGRFLSEAPEACKDQVRDLLAYMLSVKGEEESMPYMSTSFLVPLLFHLTMSPSGCKFLAASRRYVAVVEYLIKLIQQNVEVNASILFACDTLMNILEKREEIRFSPDISTFSRLLNALAYWADHSNDPLVIMTAARICSLIFDFTSEEILLNQPNFNGISVL